MKKWKSLHVLGWSVSKSAAGAEGLLAVGWTQRDLGIRLPPQLGIFLYLSTHARRNKPQWDDRAEPLEAPTFRHLAWPGVERPPPRWFLLWRWFRRTGLRRPASAEWTWCRFDGLTAWSQLLRGVWKGSYLPWLTSLRAKCWHRVPEDAAREGPPCFQQHILRSYPRLNPGSDPPTLSCSGSCSQRWRRRGEERRELCGSRTWRCCGTFGRRILKSHPTVDFVFIFKLPHQVLV